MNFQDVSGQAASEAGDVQQDNPETIITGDFTQVSNTTDSQEQQKQEETPAADDTSNKTNADRRKSDKEWQQNKEAAIELERIKKAIAGDEDTKIGKDVDPVEALLSRQTELENKLERSEWERANLPRDISEDMESTWKEACERKADPEDSWSRLSYEEIWKLAMPVADKPAINPEVTREADKEMHTSKSNMIMGSVDATGTMPIQGNNMTDLDRKIAAEMGWTEESYKNAGVSL